MQDLKGRTAVITGAASGMGLATATHLADCGMRVVLSDIEEEPLAKATESLGCAGHEVIAVRTDVSSLESIQELAARSVEAFGAVHVLHNNAGVFTAGFIEDLSIKDWEWILAVDLWSVIYGVKVFLPLLNEAGEGHIVNTSSTTGFQALAATGAYSVAKFGVIALTETLQRELVAKKSPVRASVLCPGTINTQIVNSERNRPDEVTREHKVSRAEEKYRKFAFPLIKQGMDPAEVGPMVENAIREQRFWVLTHPAWCDVLRERVEGMAEDGRLTVGNGG